MNEKLKKKLIISENSFNFIKWYKSNFITNSNCSQIRCFWINKVLVSATFKLYIFWKEFYLIKKFPFMIITELKWRLRVDDNSCSTIFDYSRNLIALSNLPTKREKNIKR